MAKIISFFNQKGGVGKTTVALNLAAALADKKNKILLIDGDPQGNLTSGIMGDETSFDMNLYEVIMGHETIEDSVVETTHSGVDLLPGSTDSAGLEIELAISGDWHYKLRNALQKIGPRYDYIFIDCPPSLGILALMALNASEEVITTIQTEYYALEGVSQLLRTVDLVRENYNSGIHVSGVLLTMVDGRNNLSLEVEKEVREFFGDLTYETTIPRNVRVAEAPGFGMSVLDYAPRSAGAESFRELAKEFLKRRKKEK